MSGPTPDTAEARAVIETNDQSVGNSDKQATLDYSRQELDLSLQGGGVFYWTKFAVEDVVAVVGYKWTFALFAKNCDATQIAQHAPSERARENAREVEHPQPGQRAFEITGAGQA